LGRARERVQVRDVHDERAAALGSRGSQAGVDRAGARVEQPGQDLLGHGVVPDADEHALSGGARRRHDGQQAGPGLFGRVDPAHAEGGQLAAQPGVRLDRQHQGNRHRVLSATAAVTHALVLSTALLNVAGSSPAAPEEHAWTAPGLDCARPGLDGSGSAPLIG
jgi:hypothetical protein